jgi:RHS repeat-associated protein
MARAHRGLAALAALAVLFIPRAAEASRTQWSPSPSPASVAPPPSSVTVDPNGNTTSKTAGGVETRFLFDIRNQLSEVQQGAAILGRYGYDYDGRRIFKVGAEGIRRYTYDQRSVITEADQAGVTVSKYDYGLDQLVRLNHRNEGKSFFHLDALGSTVNLTTDAGAARDSVFYNAWGQERDRIGASANRFTFTGHEVDRETGLFYAKARFYDPEIGRFLSQDSFLGEVNTPPSLHRYFYANDNPLIFIDKDGRQSVVLDTPRARELAQEIERAKRDLPQAPGRIAAEIRSLELTIRSLPLEERERLLPAIRDAGENVINIFAETLGALGDFLTIVDPADVTSLATPLTAPGKLARISKGKQLVKALDEAAEKGRSLRKAEKLEASVVAETERQVSRSVAAKSAEKLDAPEKATRSLREFVESLPKKPTPANRAADLFEIEQTGPFNFIVSGGGETVRVDGILDASILEAKFIERPKRSPFIPGSQIPDFLREKITKDVRDEFRRLAAVIKDPDVPFRALEVRVNDEQAVPFFKSLIDEFEIPGQVRVVETKVQQMGKKAK